MAGFRTLDDIGDRSRASASSSASISTFRCPGRQGFRRHAHRARYSGTILRTFGQGRQGHPSGAFRPAQGQDRTPRTVAGKPIAEATARGARPPGRVCIGDCDWRTGCRRCNVGAMKPMATWLLLENTRFHKPARRRTIPAFAQALAANGDIFVNDAFSAAHRAHASTEGLAHLPAGLCRAVPCRKSSTRWKRVSAIPGSVRCMAIVGGAKVSTKIDLLIQPRDQG